MIKLPYFKIIIAALNKLKMPCRSFDFPLIRTRNRRNHNLFFQSLLSISSFNLFFQFLFCWRSLDEEVVVRSEKNSTENGASGGIKFVVIVLKLLPPFLHSAPSTYLPKFSITLLDGWWSKEQGAYQSILMARQQFWTSAKASSKRQIKLSTKSF